ncbi:MAG: PIG-L deacetylase family protein [Dissulfurispiraceae bacterium]
MNDLHKSLFEAERILVLAPHPDDETLGCGGTIARFTQSGKKVRVLIVSRGDAVNIEVEELVEKRKEEARRACDILGVEELLFHDFPDGKLNSYQHEIKDAIRKVILSYTPAVIFSPSPMDFHPDHQSIAKIIVSLLRECGTFQVAFYEVYQPIRYNCVVDIADTMSTKERAVGCYNYSLLCKPEAMLHAVKGLNAFRSFAFLTKGFFEAFYVISPADSEDSIIDWLTYGLSKEASSYMLLFQLRKVDQLLSSYHESLKRIDELNASLFERQGKVEALQHKLTSFEESVLIKGVGSFYKVRDALLPYGTKRRGFYDRVSRVIKSTIQRLSQ